MKKILAYMSAARNSDKAATRLDVARIDWTACLPMLNENGLAPLLHEFMLRDGALEMLPKNVTQELDRARKTTLAAQMLFQKCFLEIMDVCKKAGAALIPTKGIYLCECVYPAPGTRPMRDIDVLVDADKFDAALDAMRGAGFECNLDFLARRGRPLPSGVTMQHDGRNINIDVHRSLLNTEGIRGLLLSERETARLDAEAAAATRGIVYIDRRIEVLAPAHFMLSLILHHYTHNFDGLLWLLDGVLFARTMNENDWNTFSECVECYKLSAAAAVYLKIAEKNLYCDIASFSPAKIVEMCEKVLRNEPLLAAAVRRGRLGPLSSLALVPDSLRRVQSIARFLFPTREYLESVNHKPLEGREYIQESFKFQMRVMKR